MKICWDNLEKLRYNKRTGKWYSKKYHTNTFIYKEECKNCKEPFLCLKYSKGIFCSYSCSQQGENNNFYGKKRPEHSKWMKENVERYDYSRLKENNSNWKGGISKNPYCLGWNILTTELKEYDDYKCQNPQCEGNVERMTSHHIDYNRKNCHPDNLITLCSQCNGKANGNRDWWQKYYIKIKEKRNEYNHSAQC